MSSISLDNAAFKLLISCAKLEKLYQIGSKEQILPAFLSLRVAVRGFKELPSPSESAPGYEEFVRGKEWAALLVQRGVDEFGLPDSFTPEEEEIYQKHLHKAKAAPILRTGYSIVAQFRAISVFKQRKPEEASWNSKFEEVKKLAEELHNELTVGVYKDMTQPEVVAIRKELHDLLYP